MTASPAGAPGFFSSNWFRSTGQTGWYSETYGGGIYMVDATWVRVYNNKAFYVGNEIVATGGLPDRNRLLMQIYADVTGRPIKVAGTSQGGALGSAIFAAVAAGRAAGGYDSVEEAAHAMARLRDESYTPNPAATAVYDRLFAEYLTLHDYFGRGGNDVMKRLKALKAEVLRA